MLAVEGLDPLERIELYVRRIVVHNLNDLSASRSTTTSSIASARSAGAPYHLAAAHDRFMRDLIREAQEPGLADASVDAGMLANCVFATVIWPYRWFHGGSADTPETIAETCTAFVTRGLVGGFAPAA